MASIMSVRQAAQLDMAAERAGATAADMDRLGQGDMLAQILPFIRGLAIVQIIKHIFNLAVAPFCPLLWIVEPDGHQVGDPKFEWDSTKVALYLDEGQKTGIVNGTELREKLKGQRVFNANLLDHLLSRPELIPDDWKGKAVFFWGTIYRGPSGNLLVRYLYWDSKQWRWHYRLLVSEFMAGGPALVSSSSPAEASA